MKACTDRTGFRLCRIAPDTITIYRDALLDVCESADEVVEEVAITVIHEIAHHFGIDDDRLEELAGPDPHRALGAASRICPRSVL